MNKKIYEIKLPIISNAKLQSPGFQLYETGVLIFNE